MTASTEPRGGLDLGWSHGEDGWGDAMNANLMRLSRLGFHPSVLSATTTAPPGSPVSGSGYIIPSGATGAWAGKTGQVAVWDGSAWAYAVPRDGWTMHVDGAGLTTYDGGAWSQANVATAAGVGAEPSITGGTAAQYWSGLKSWADFSASVRASVLTGLSFASNAVVAATDSVLAAIGKLQAQVSLRLPIDGPTFTGNLTGSASIIWRLGDARYFSLYGTASEWGLRDLEDGGSVLAYPIVVKRGVNQELQLGYSGGIRPVRIGGAITNTELSGPGSRPLVATSTGLIDDQDAATFRDTIGAGTSSLALGSDSTTAHRGDHGTTAYSHSQSVGNPHGTTASQVGALAKITLTGTIDSQAINGGAPGLYDLHGSVYANFPGSWSASAGGTLLQTVAKNGRILQELHSEINGKMIQAQTGPTTWSGWTRIWDNDILPVSTTGLAVVTASSQAAARAAIGLAQAEILIHSDFGRSATTDVWQSAFTNNAASGLQLAANTIAAGTEITIEQVANLPGDAGNSTYQVYIGPQLTGDQSPIYPRYVNVLDPEVSYGEGKLCVKIELIGSGSSIIGYVTSTWTSSDSATPTVGYGTLEVDGTIANSIDVRFNPDSQTNYIIRRNRVFRRNP